MSERLLAALSWAAHQHRDQRRKGVSASPYINHCVQVAELLARCGVTDEDVLVAAVLHDVVEDTEAGPADVEARFGARVAGFVAEVTDDKSLAKAARKAAQVEHAAHISPQAARIKLADKTCNLLDLAAEPPTGWPAERLVEYVAWARRVVDAVRGAHADLEAPLLAAFEYAESQAATLHREA